MKTITKTLQALGATALFMGSATVFSAPAIAQDVSLSDILRRVQQDSQQMSAEDQRRLQEFRQQTAEQERLMQEARSDLNAAEARGRQLSAEFDENERRLGELSAELETQAGDFGELLGQFRSAAGETMPIIRESLSNYEYSGRAEKLAEVSEARSLPTREDLDALPKAMLQEMIAQSEVKSFTADVAGAGPEGEVVNTDLMRVGIFTAATTDDARFVEVITENTDEPYLRVLKAQPGGDFTSAMRSLINAGEGEVVITPVDPTKGDLFAVQGEMPTLEQRIAQGGVVGAVILTLLAIGAAFAIFKIVTLFLMSSAMRKTAKTRQAGTGNPLARVFEAYETNKQQDLESLELKLDEQILRETPKIERFNDIVKVLAAVAPLLGLLGTVIGMIITFTAITNFGAGDPKLMAGGISVALMTTVLGLVAAIPLLLLHAVAASLARGNQQILDEQAAGLVAERAESNTGTA
ncbi:MotA/TolQ/ExbB proton channel family protein [Henriciella aquimarina]|uniref:MotA/TolQ/ExbB proton channel family protein n=1 Tax=Henriciella aquimarina TaxID=545261 RepID=UPI0009FB96D3|nr:MotA/TolQ/ExbB proton channel family protein [Henriciella aquimarina]